MNASRPRIRRRASGATLARIAALGPFVAAAMAAERRAPRCWPLRFPRSPDDFDRDPERLFKLLTVPSRGLLAPLGDPARSRLLGQTRGDGITGEPDKNRMTGFFDLDIEEDGRRHTVHVVTKFQSGQGMPLYMQAVRAVVEYGFAREIEFYRRLAHVVPVETPRPLFADAVTLINRVCLVLERVDGTTPTDWRGCSPAAIELLLANAAKLNAAFVNRTGSGLTSWIPARSGLEFAEFVTGFIRTQPTWYQGIWAALQTYFHALPVTLVHGDCRPGNMLFRGVDLSPADGDEDTPATWRREPTSSEAGVVMADWQAINVAPVLWDFTYCTTVGLRCADRRQWQPRLLDRFLAELRDLGVGAPAIDETRAPLDVQMLAIVLAYISLAVADHNLWAGQGNTADDIAAWKRRVLEAGAGGEAAEIARALGVAEDDVRRLQDYFSGRIRN
jgi:hypothetical protein